MKANVNTVTDDVVNDSILCLEELNDKIRERGVWPRPRFEVGGRRYLVLQDQEHERKGSIIVPEEYRGKHQSTSGIILQVGDGYDEDRGYEDWSPPYTLGDRIAWGKYNHTEIEIDLLNEKDWWTQEELEGIPPDMRKVKFIILNTHQVFGRLL